MNNIAGKYPAEKSHSRWKFSFFHKVHWRVNAWEESILQSLIGIYEKNSVALKKRVNFAFVI